MDSLSEILYPFYISYKATENARSYEGVSMTYIEELLYYLLPSFCKGVYDVTKIPSSLSSLETFCIVLHTTNHFVLLYVSSDEIFYFDPAGESIQTAQKHFKQNEKPITMFLKKCFSEFPKRTLHVNTTKLQPNGSVHCGFYCVLYALYLSQPKNTIKITFQQNVSENDEKCVYFLCKLIDSLQP